MNDTMPPPVELVPVAIEESFVAPPEVVTGARPGFWKRLGNGIASAFDWIFGAVALVIGLSLLAATPVLQFLCFGYLLEASGRVARSGRLRAGFVGVRKAARLGSIAIGCTLVLLPLQVFAGLARSAAIVDPGGPVARRFRVALVVLTVLAVLHLIAACARGGRLRYFFWPFSNPFWLLKRLRRGGLYTAARDDVWEFVVALRLPHYFRLGLLGFLGTMAWLVLPVTLIALGHGQPVLGFLGAILLGVVAMALPFLQMRFAAEDRFRALFEYRAVHGCYQRAPWAFAAALLVTLAFAVPLYLLKIEMIPRETVWLPSLVFLAFIFPARLVTGWAYSRAARRAAPRHWFWRAAARLSMLPTAAAYVFIVFLTQYTAWRGILSLYEQHAFLLPVPFLNM